MSFTSITCPHCRIEHVRARITSGAQLPDENGETRYFFVAVCGKCGFPSIMVARRTGTRMAEGAQLVKHVCFSERDPIPNIVEPVDMIPSPGTAPTPDGLPGNVSSTYLEALEAMRRGAVNSAAMGLRLTLERATRALKGDPKKPLGERIAALVAARALPPTLGQWAGEIPLVREEPALAENDPSAEDLQSARQFTEMFLTCAFTLPNRIENRRGLGGDPDEPQPGAEQAGDDEAGAPDFRPRRGGPAGRGTPLYGR